MPTTVNTTRRAGHRGRATASPGGVRGPWQPAGTDEALAVMDRVARYCEYTCAPTTTQCAEDDCAAWTMERAAATCVMQRWVDGEG